MMDDVKSIKKFMVLINSVGDSCYTIIEVIRISPVYCYDISDDVFSIHNNNDIDLVVDYKFKNFFTGEVNYMNKRGNLNYDDILKYLLYQSNSYYECMNFIELSIGSKNYNI